MRTRKRLLVSATIAAAISAAGAATAAADVPDATAPAASQAAAKGCGGNVVATPKKWTYANSSCSVIGYPGARVTYRWTIRGGNSNAGLQVYGFDAQGHGQWYGCGWGGGVCTVSWGNVAATPKVRAWNATGTSAIDFSTR